MVNSPVREGRGTRTSGSRYSGVWVYTPYSRLHFRVASSRSIAFPTSHFVARRYLDDETIRRLGDHDSELVYERAPQQTFVALGVTEAISTSPHRDTARGTTHQPEFFLFRELALLFTRKRVPVLGEVFEDLIVHIFLLSREFRWPSIGSWLGRRNRDVVYRGHDERWRWGY